MPDGQPGVFAAQSGYLSFKLGQAAGGFLPVFSSSDPSPLTASTVNPSTPIAALWATGIGLAPHANRGTIGVYSVGGPLDVVLDLVGYFR